MELACVALICHSSINTGMQPATVMKGVYNKIREIKTEKTMLSLLTFHNNREILHDGSNVTKQDEEVYLLGS